MMRSTGRRLGGLPPTNVKPAPYTGLSKAEVLAIRKNNIHGSIPLYYKDPVLLVQGSMQYVWDEKGTRYLDLFGGVCTVGCGHSHPRITSVIKRAAERLQHTTLLYLTEECSIFAKTLADKLPAGEEWVVYPTNSGSEANDLATLMARAYTKRFDIVSIRNGYHGASEGTRGITAVRNWVHEVPGGFGVRRAICPNPYRGAFAGQPNALDKYVGELEDLIQQETSGNVAGFIAERFQGVGGCQPLMDGYINKAYEIVRKAGGVCISDEVQCGWGRLGSHYWGFQTEGVVPDIVVMAKSIGNGLPLAAVAAKKSIAQSVHKVHFNTYGGNPLSAAVGTEVIKIIEEEKMQENCKVVGTAIIDGLKNLQKQYPIIGDIRGRGLMIGMEFVKDPATKAYHPDAAVNYMEKMREFGVLVGKGGPYGSVARIQPPMCITLNDAAYFLDCTEKALKSGL